MAVGGRVSGFRSSMRTLRDAAHSVNAVALSALIILFLVYPSRLGESLRSVMDNVFGSMKENGVSHASGEYHGAKVAFDLSSVQNVTSLQHKDLDDVSRQLQVMQENNKALASALEDSRRLDPTAAALIKRSQVAGKKASEVLQQTNQSKASFQQLMVSASSADNSSRYGVVIGGSPELRIVEGQVNRAKQAGFVVSIYKIGNVYNNIFPTSNMEEAKAMLPKLRSIDPYAAGAYLINISKWCPSLIRDAQGVNTCIS